MSSGSKIHWRIVVGVLTFHTAVGLWEAWTALDCYWFGGECWPWLVLFVLGLPVSIPVVQLVGALDWSFYPGLVLCFVGFVGAATLSWSVLLHMVAWGASFTVSRFRRSDA